MTVLANLALALVLTQYIPAPRAPRVPPQVNPGGANTDAIATFAGTLKFVDKKTMTVEVEDGQTLQMSIKGSTRFFRDDKPAKTTDFHTGESITVDAYRDAHFTLIAVRVEPAKPAPKSAPKPDN